MILVENVREKCILNKPVVIGFAILELSKIVMYDYYYNKL
jgi:hypothetical protein